MSNHNKLPEVNNYIKKHKLRPCETEEMCGSLYDNFNDITYLVVYGDNTYISYSSHYTAYREVSVYNGSLVVCRGKIHE